MNFSEALTLELIKTGLTFLTLLFGWVLGQRIIAYWDIRKKRQELDIATATEFYKLYGEFKEVSRLWRSYCFHRDHRTASSASRSLWSRISARARPVGAGDKLLYSETIPMELLRRAAAAEGGVEAIIVKVAAERMLSEEDIRVLGLFRQAYQKLREAIRALEPLEWTHNTREYTLYNDLASKTAAILSSNRIKRRPKSDESPAILRKITAVRSEDWETELDRAALLQSQAGLA